MKTLKVKEIFYSIQGEGTRSGEASIFIRLAKCNLNCWFCDTDWSKGDYMTFQEIAAVIEKYNCKWIIWTGGEPTLQLSYDIVEWFKEQGYKQAIESNGLLPIPENIDWKVISPKQQLETVKKANPICDEIRLVVSDAKIIPKQEYLPLAKHYYLSPVFLGEEKKRLKIDMHITNYVIKYIKNNPEWKLSIQSHKLIGIE